jgi:hypothetical protein
MAAYSQYVWAKKGLILRTQPSKTGEKIKTLPYGTKVDYLEQYIVNDSVLIIPSCKQTDGTVTDAFYLSGYWVKVQVGQDIGFLFDGYLSEMLPYKSKDDGAGYGMDGISQWLLQQASILDTIRVANDYDDFTVAYSNHVIQTIQSGEGGGSTKFIFPAGSRFKDGFLLQNYFLDFDFTQKKLKEAEMFYLKKEENYLYFESIGYEGQIFWMFSIWFNRGVLIIEKGAGC